MDISTALQRLHRFDLQGIYVYTKGNLRRVFFDDTQETFKQSLSRLIKQGILERPCRGVYLFALSRRDSYAVEHIACALRRGEYNYVSLESALSEYGVISQIPISYLTVMTTGRKGIFKTPYGTIEFTHTKRDDMDILYNTIKVQQRPLRMATQATALRDLKRVGRNLHMLIDED
ncbi:MULTISPECIES: type IV toxin-antitoxin system AbiEi family antitoxin [unclassified Shewanella]|uniref:type IV toxin-antitoxin system AbiEi family antitoxin n=1 Tax=unclassified Shewanella TaxID=196818 RepID=UPI0039B3D563